MRRALKFVFLFSFPISLLSLLYPIYSMQVFDRVFTSRSVETLVGLTGIILIGYVFYGILHAVRASVVARIVEWLERTVSPQLLQMSIVQAAETGMPMAGQHQRDLMNIKNFIASAAPILMDVPWSLIFVIVVYMINPVLGFLTVIGLVILIGSALINEYATRRVLMRATEKNVEAALNAEMLARQGEAIQAMGMGDAVVGQWERDNLRGLSLQDMAQQRSAIVNGFSRSARMVLQIGITGIGAYLALKNELSAGGLIASSLLVARALAPFEGTITLWKSFIGARDAYQRLHQLFVGGRPIQSGTQLPTPYGDVLVDSLYVAIGKSAPILRNINLHLAAGESLGIIGPSAAGKSTLVKAMVGIYPPQHGHVRLDGADIYTWARADVGPHIGYLPQQVELFNGSIKQNIARMAEEPSDAAVIEAAQKAGVHEMILQLPQAYDTPYVPGNSVLSPGQKQRIGLARALYGAPCFVVLDEPNSNMDGDGERALMQTLAVLKQMRVTTVIVAHRPSVLASVDKVLMLRAGMVDVLGPREEVMQRFTAGAQRLRPTEGGA
jgi:PrtD family type I secretion system ABC transporter